MEFPLLPICEEQNEKENIEAKDPNANGTLSLEPLTSATGNNTTWDEIYWQVRQEPPSIPDWDSDAQHELHCECEVCVTYYRAITNSILQPLQN